ncbi:transcription termination/antitermination protein NusG [Gemmobacter sp.]|uniref:transcription termination/antitermination protein NusG n=1 Tax=Gemmobacter sp. TaxID=1898957 RepID=UPI002AFE189B|nr:transcription termination/antitermination NusG family protein [Gemmobacter sp.]
MMPAHRSFLSLSVGDAVALDRTTGAIVTPGPSRWYALRVAPQREDQAEAWLRLRGVYAFHPVLMRRVRRHGVVREIQRRYLPGYVFARFKGEPRAHLVLTCPFITGALSRADGSWGVLEPQKLAAIHAMRKVDADGRIASQVRAAQRRADAMARPGEPALFTGGAFAGTRCEVVELAADGGATVRMSLFGGEVLVSAQAADLVGLRKPS